MPKTFVWQRVVDVFYAAKAWDFEAESEIEGLGERQPMTQFGNRLLKIW